MSGLVEVLSLEVLFALFRSDSLRTRILLLKIVDIFLHIPAFRSRFQLTKGFQVLGTLIAPFSVSEELFGVLFSILLGKPAHKYQPTEPMRTYFPGHLTADSTTRHPAAIYPILMLVSSESIAPNLQHLVLKTLHDMFLQSDDIKDLFLEHELNKLLCDLFLPELERKQPAALEESIRKELFPEKAQEIEEKAPRNKDQWRTEEDILSFLKAIILYGCMTNAGIALINDVLVVRYFIDITHADFESLDKLACRLCPSSSTSCDLRCVKFLSRELLPEQSHTCHHFQTPVLSHMQLRLL